MAIDRQKESEGALSGGESFRLLREKARDGSLREVWQDWKWILSFSRRRWLRILLYTLFGIGTSAVSLGAGVLSKYLIDSIVSLDKARLVPLALAMVAAGAVSVLFGSVSARFSARLGVTMQNDVRRQVFNSLLDSRWMELTRFSTGDLLSRLNGDVNTVAGCAVSWLPTVVIQLFTLVGTLCVVLYYDPVMALIAFASTPVLFLASRSLLRRQRHFQKRMRQVAGGISNFESETFRNIDTLKSFGVEADMSRKLESWQETYRDVALEYNRFSVRTNILLSALGTAVQYLAMGYCLFRMWRGEILFGTMVLFLQQRSSLSSAFSALVGQIPAALSGSVAAERIRELTRLEKEPRRSQCLRAEGPCRLELRDVRAGYAPGRSVLSQVELTAQPGQVVALVGPSGEGKTTLMRLLLGLIPPQQGEIYLVDREGNRLDLGSDTRHLIAYVPQGNTVLAGTVAENLLLAAPEATPEELTAALKDACAWEFVSRLPQGIHTPIGEGGKGLSEGQAQRIAIARALMRKAPVLLLDEVTSALDPETEERVLENLTARGYTCVAATHRLSVLDRCQRIYRVRQGRVEPITPEEARRSL